MLTPGDDPSWGQYPDTLLVMGGRVIDLRKPLESETRQYLRGIGPAPEFAVITAANPTGRTKDEAANEARHHRLRDLLASSGTVHQPADGCSPDMRHRERGFAVWVPLRHAQSLAVTFEQSALFWFDGDAFSIQGALLATPPFLLPVPGRSPEHGKGDPGARSPD